MDRQAVRPWPKRDASIEIGGWARSTLRIRCPALERLAKRLIISVIAVTSRGKWRTRRVVANAALLLPVPGFRGTSFNATAAHCMHSNCTPGGVPAGGSTHADTINHVHTRAACFADLREHAVLLMKRRERHGLRRGCEGQSKGNSDQPDHFLFSDVNPQEEFS